MLLLKSYSIYLTQEFVIDEEQIKIIKHCHKSFIFHKNSICTKKIQFCFLYEVFLFVSCETVGIFLLWEMAYEFDNVQIYSNDVLLCLKNCNCSKADCISK